MIIVQAILFSIAVSLDGFGVGLSYGMRGIKIPKLSFLIICMSSVIAISISMCLGSVVAFLLPISFAEKLGAVLLIMVGAWILIQNFVTNIIPDFKCYTIKFQSLGLIIDILKEPVEADLDNSGSISINEAIFLGIALAMDAFGAGFAAAISGYSLMYIPAFVAASKFIMVSLGLYLGKAFGIDKLKGRLTLIPGGLIILLGLANLL